MSSKLYWQTILCERIGCRDTGQLLCVCLWDFNLYSSLRLRAAISLFPVVIKRHKLFQTLENVQKIGSTQFFEVSFSHIEEPSWRELWNLVIFPSGRLRLHLICLAPLFHVTSCMSSTHPLAQWEFSYFRILTWAHWTFYLGAGRKSSWKCPEHPIQTFTSLGNFRGPTLAAPAGVKTCCMNSVG